MKINYSDDAIEFIAKIADGGMRDAITLVDKCLAYSTDLTLENVVKVLGIVDYLEMFSLLSAIPEKDFNTVIDIINKYHMAGKDLKLFIEHFLLFLLDISCYKLCKSFNLIQIPSFYEQDLNNSDTDTVFNLLRIVKNLYNEIKWEDNPKLFILSELIAYMRE